MKLTTRFSGGSTFLEIKADETQAEVFKNGNEAIEVINNLLEVIEDLCHIAHRDFHYQLTEKE